MRDIETIDSELRLLAAVRWSIREHGGEPSSRSTRGARPAEPHSIQGGFRSRTLRRLPVSRFESCRGHRLTSENKSLCKVRATRWRGAIRKGLSQTMTTILMTIALTVAGVIAVVVVASSIVERWIGLLATRHPGGRSSIRWSIPTRRPRRGRPRGKAGRTGSPRGCPEAAQDPR